jgi:ubiquinone/menaquinone biosynthesis C-methylase UbiE
MVQDTFQLGQGAAGIYEQQKVKAIFRPLAEAMLAKVDVSNDDIVLDVACGTGIVARTIEECASPYAPITGVDLNDGMIETARILTTGASDKFQWFVSDVTRMPFADNTFTLAICQQGLQFFPDETAAIREIRRVLRQGGRLVLTVWSVVSPLFKALADAIGRHVSPEVAARSLAPFSYPGLTSIPSLLEASGFSKVQQSELTVDRIIQNPDEAIPREILGNPVGPAVAACGEKVMADIVADVLAACADLRQGSNLIAPQTARLFVAVAD